VDGKLRRQSTVLAHILCHCQTSRQCETGVIMRRSPVCTPFRSQMSQTYLLYRLLVSLSFICHLLHIVQDTLSPPDRVFGSVNFVLTLVLPMDMPYLGSISGKVGCARMQ
jgi:hypothetical protein